MNNKSGYLLKKTQERLDEIIAYAKENPSMSRQEITFWTKKRFPELKYATVSVLISRSGIFPKKGLGNINSQNPQNPENMICRKCGIEKPQTEFTTRGKTKIGKKRYSYCRKCQAEYVRIEKLRNFYNLTQEEYIKLGDSCSVCGREKKKIELSVDHDHKTGLIRGKLCHRCNRGIAWFEDKPELLKNAAQYLIFPPAIEIFGKEIYGMKGRVGSKRNKKHYNLTKDFEE